MITAYLRQLPYHRQGQYRVEPIKPTSDPTYEHPDQPQKGKRDSSGNEKKTQKFPERIFISKGHTLSIWV